MATLKPHPAHSLILEEHVKSALKNEKGEEAEFTSFEIKDFDSDGDGYIGFIGSVLVRFTVGDVEDMTSYVLKINPTRPPETSELEIAALFEHETQFYDLLPKMNMILSRNQQTFLGIPRCYYYCLERNKEIIYLEDMKKKHFRLCTDTSNGVDKCHTLVVLKELAKMHAASKLLAEEEGVECFTEKYKFLKSLFGKEDYPNFYDTFKNYHTGGMNNGADIAQLVGGFEKVENYLRKSAPDIMQILANWHKKASPNFKVLSHGDLWINNVLFRYDESGRPLKACILDFQCSTSASLAMDLNHFLYVCLTAKERNDNIDEFLSVYYNSFKSVLDSAGKPMEFSIENLKEEYREYNLYGLTWTCIDLVVILMRDFCVFDFHDMTEEKLKLFKDQVLKAVETLPSFKSRVLDTFEEITRNGLV